MLGVLVKVSAAIVELIPGPLLRVERHARGALNLLLEPMVSILLLELKVPVRAGAGAHFIEGALIPNDIGPADLLRRFLAIVIVVLKVPRHHSWWPFRLRVRDGSRSDRRALVLRRLRHCPTNLFRLRVQGDVIEVILEAPDIAAKIAVAHWKRGLLLRLGHRGRCGVGCLVVGAHVEVTFVGGVAFRDLQRLVVAHAHGRGI
jgi:hypothetical protein